MPSKYGVQPAHAIIISQGRTVAGVARVCGIPRQHLSTAVRGMVLPSPDVKRELPRLLRVPLRDLFTPEVLRGTYDGRRGGAPRRQSVSS